MLVALRDERKTDASIIARAREPGDGLQQKSVMEQIEQALAK